MDQDPTEVVLEEVVNTEVQWTAQDPVEVDLEDREVGNREAALWKDKDLTEEDLDRLFSVAVNTEVLWMVQDLTENIKGE